MAAREKSVGINILSIGGGNSNLGVKLDLPASKKNDKCQVIKKQWEIKSRLQGPEAGAHRQ